MDARDSDIRAEHLGIEYRFCMEQCRENFLARPGLYIGKQSPARAGRQIIKRRSFTLDRPVIGLQREALMVELKRLMGVRNISIEGDRLSIDYNLLEVTAGQVEAALAQAGAAIGSGWAERLKRGWVRYTEENELDHLASGQAACCNKPPAKG
jgi:YHS domain-containing protein